MGVLILTIALMPSPGSRTLHLMKAESPGPVVSKLVPKTSQSSKILYGMYCALTAIEVLCLRLAGMPWFDCIVNSFATAGTGGFAVRNASIGAYGSPAVEVIITVFMLAFSVNFALYFLLLCGKVRQVFKSDEFRFFLGIVAASILLISVNIHQLYPTMEETVRHAAFQVGSIISTTGFCSTNFDLWPEFSRILLVLLMFVVPEGTLHSILVFFAVYMFITFAATLVIALDNSSFGTSFTSVIACIGNIGPGLDLVGPMGNYAPSPGSPRWCSSSP